MADLTSRRTFLMQASLAAAAVLLLGSVLGDHDGRLVVAVTEVCELAGRRVELGPDLEVVSGLPRPCLRCGHGAQTNHRQR